MSVSEIFQDHVFQLLALALIAGALLAARSLVQAARKHRVSDQKVPVVTQTTDLSGAIILSENDWAAADVFNSGPSFRHPVQGFLIDTLFGGSYSDRLSFEVLAPSSMNLCFVSGDRSVFYVVNLDPDPQPRCREFFVFESTEDKPLSSIARFTIWWGDWGSDICTLGADAGPADAKTTKHVPLNSAADVNRISNPIIRWAVVILIRRLAANRKFLDQGRSTIQSVREDLS